ncbi:MAG: hypothetical protein KGI25_08930 [Thaumarchaeota archaeon]|nr:hypothetical protein [Nitrososphaerota archaeon]
MNELEQLLGCNYPWATNRAQQALQIKAAVEANQITKEQATELLQDLINTDQLDKEATDFSVKTQLVNAVTNLISILSNVTSIPGVHI